MIPATNDSTTPELGSAQLDHLARAACATRRNVLATLAGGAAVTALTVGSLPADAAEHADAELLALGAQLTDAWLLENQAYAAGDTPEKEEAAERAQDVTREIVGRILDAPARTLSGLLVKVRAFNWCHCDEPFRLAALDDDPYPCTDIRLVGSIMTDLCAMKSAQA